MVEAWLIGNPDDVTSVEVATNSKITEQHRSRPAYIYVRQSTNAQVLHHQESTERQYALRTMALELGWNESAIRTLDRDLGMTGTEMTRSGGFQDSGGGCLDGPSGCSVLLRKSHGWRARISTGIGCWSCIC